MLFEIKKVWIDITKGSYSRVSKNILTLPQRKITLLQLTTGLLLTLILAITAFHNLYSLDVDRIAERFRNKQASEQYAFKRTDNSSNKTMLLFVEMNSRREEFNRRSKRVENICASYNQDDLQINASNFPNIIIDTKHGISWCPIYKAASSTWMKHFATLSGLMTNKAINLINENAIQINAIVKQAYPKDLDFRKTIEKLNSTKKFLIVRHPFERLLSAYRDKLECMKGREYYYKRFGRHIAYKYRKYRKVNDTKLEPTFQEFLRFIVDEKYFDEHWVPYYDSCKPCVIHYDYILKFETFKEDNRFFIQEAGLIKEYLLEKNDLRNVNPHGPTTKVLLKKYFQEIPQWLFQDIYKIYAKDFELYSYSV